MTVRQRSYLDPRSLAAAHLADFALTFVAPRAAKGESPMEIAKEFQDVFNKSTDLKQKVSTVLDAKDVYGVSKDVVESIKITRDKEKTDTTKSSKKHD